jgi:hypothetical protein
MSPVTSTGHLLAITAWQVRQAQQHQRQVLQEQQLRQRQALLEQQEPRQLRELRELQQQALEQQVLQLLLFYRKRTKQLQR